RSAFLKLDAGLMEAPGTASPYPAGSYGSPAPVSPYAPGGSPAPKAPAAAAAPVTPPVPGLQPMPRPARNRWVIPVVIGALVLIVVAALLLFRRGGDGALMADGIQAYGRGDKVTAA